MRSSSWKDSKYALAYRNLAATMVDEETVMIKLRDGRTMTKEDLLAAALTA
jgi:hypothetical protein